LLGVVLGLLQLGVDEGLDVGLVFLLGHVEEVGADVDEEGLDGNEGNCRVFDGLHQEGEGEDVSVRPGGGAED
jgi:hypothetical protein